MDDETREAIQREKEEREVREQEKRNKRNEAARLRRSLNPGAGTGAIALDLLNRNNGYLSLPEESRAPKQRKVSIQKNEGDYEISLPCTFVTQSPMAVPSTAREILESFGNRTIQFRKNLLSERLSRIQEEAAFIQTQFDLECSQETFSNENRKKDSGWATSQKKTEEGFKENEEFYTNAFTEQFALSWFTSCASCSVVPNELGSRPIHCWTCRESFCPDCDRFFHSRQPFHDRELLEEFEGRTLLSDQFLEQFSPTIVQQSVCVPLFTPVKCENCREIGSIRKVASSTDVTVLMPNGRFDVKKTSFYCTSCKATKEASNDVYIKSRFFPATTESTNFFVSFEVLNHWHHYQHLNRSVSLRKYIETYEQISADMGRVVKINRPHFTMASRQYEHLLHRISKKLLLKKFLSCLSCGPKPLAIHFDGLFKLPRWDNPKQFQSKSLFGNDVIQFDEDRRAHEAKINTLKKGSTVKASCGPSTYAAGKEDGKKRKNLAITGVILASCRHGVELGATNLDKGENYRAVHFLHEKLPSDIMCQDIVCHYWKFAEDIDKLFPEFRSVTMGCTPFLSRWHGKTHSIECQIQYLGHFVDGAGATLGEEQEQANAYFAPLGLRTKRMNDATRRDVISSHVCYYNESKNFKMDSTLQKRIIVALKKSECYEKALESLLKSNGTHKWDLPKVYERLKKFGASLKDKKKSDDQPLGKERYELESSSFLLKRLKSRIQLEAVTAKERTKIRISMRKARTKCNDLLGLINQEIPDLKLCAQKRINEGKGLAGDDEIIEWDLITEKNIEDGIFPWQQFGSSIREDFELVNVWMLSLRFKEEIGISLKEMADFLAALCGQNEQLCVMAENLKKTAVRDSPQVPDKSNVAAERQWSESYVYRGSAVIVNKEINKIRSRIMQAKQKFQDFVEIENPAADSLENRLEMLDSSSDEDYGSDTDDDLSLDEDD